MPREQLEIDLPLERLSIVAADGSCDDDLLPDVGDEELLGLYQSMLRARRFDERLLELQREGRIGTFAPVKGQEAAQVGAVAALEQSDWVVPAFRETAAALARGVSMTDIILYNAGYNEGAYVREGARDLPIAVPVASQLPHAVGIAYAARCLGTDEIVLTFFGDGATSEGDFHEAMNFAAVFGVPVVFVCQNNHWAISVPRERQTHAASLAQKAVAYGMPGIQVDGNDVVAVRTAALEAGERARRGDGPTLIECDTYRLSVHTTADDPTRYRDEADVEAWAERDPLKRLRVLLDQRGACDEDGHAKLEDDIANEIAAAWERTQSRIAELDDVGAMFDHLYAELPEYLRRQRDEIMQREQAAGSG